MCRSCTTHLGRCTGRLQPGHAVLPAERSPGDRPLNYAKWAQMGMASSTALGLALAQPDGGVVVLDGDGAASNT